MFINKIYLYLKKITMRKTLVSLAVLAVLAGTATFAWGRFGGFYHSNTNSYFTNPVYTAPVASLTDEEKEALLKMRQEEKLARDVYLTLYEKYGLRVFANIAKSEQRHTDMVKYLLTKYWLEDPITDDTVGVFKDQSFTDLYNQLVAQGSQSVVDALKVGATIEDLDIKDLEDELTLTDKADLQTVFTNLKYGSYNHMRAFVRLLQAYGSDYQPQYISQEEFDSILAWANRWTR